MESIYEIIGMIVVWSAGLLMLLTIIYTLIILIKAVSMVIHRNDRIMYYFGRGYTTEFLRMHYRNYTNPMHIEKIRRLAAKYRLRNIKRLRK